MPVPGVCGADDLLYDRDRGHENAVAGVHDHIVAFWSPSMRRDLSARARQDATGLDPIVVEALHRLGQGPSPTAREAAGPAEVGQMGADDAG